MKPKYFLLASIGLIILFLLVFYNYLKAQQALKDIKSSPLEVSLVSFPTEVKVGNRGTFVWQVNAAPDLSTDYTTLYWSYQSSPSALTKFDSPQAVGYPSSQKDYISGLFALPDSFEVAVKFEKPGKVYFRAYARVGKDHLWSPEESLVVTK